jgi:DNA-binding response OmpR family regulator
MTKILLVEDDWSLGATLRDRLTKEGYDVVWTRTKRASTEAVQQNVFDLYLFDVGLPDGDGFDLAKDLPAKPFIFLTAQGDAESRLKGYDLGAEEYIPKPFHLRELLMRIRHVLENHMPATELALGDIRVNFSSFEFVRGGNKEAVASRDLMLLKLLVEKSPNAVTRDEALNCMRGEDKFPSNRTVDNAIVRLRSALGDYGVNIESIRGVGYRWNLGVK